ncbi:DUF2789 domain-containing protein [Pokkaliibacter sp. MBI-7]|uniref:DUF2789 domain-containing protein n=1 Tax=Proteobacteria bacterium 228 TaxID=2083153 RepID=A0A2S5KKW9_9PROT|nr:MULTISPECIES: DUF2789 domain-containing protein [Pokkaliibacter]MDH2431195.1 DUF2789 domain-containing protein [Pokkaliibacter sp. MBI-7]PPC75487.1 DUF2789 domain-containing protein [Pokkaliibacter plantistimulans]
MDTTPHTLNTLFQQLGLPDDSAKIDHFISHHSPLPDELLLHQAQCWTLAQSRFLRDALAEDSDWAEVVDELNVMMRSTPTH